MSIKIDDRQLKAVTDKLGSIEDFQKWATPAMNQSLALLQDDIADYPPKPSHSTYRRTGTLGRRWTTAIQKLGSGIRGRLGNNTAYAPWVQSATQQVSFHKRTGWKTDEQVTDNNRDRIERIFQRAINRVLNR